MIFIYGKPFSFFEKERRRNFENWEEKGFYLHLQTLIREVSHLLASRFIICKQANVLES